MRSTAQGRECSRVSRGRPGQPARPASRPGPGLPHFWSDPSSPSRSSPGGFFGKKREKAAAVRPGGVAAARPRGACLLRSAALLPCARPPLLWNCVTERPCPIRVWRGRLDRAAKPKPRSTSDARRGSDRARPWNQFLRSLRVLARPRRVWGGRGAPRGRQPGAHAWPRAAYVLDQQVNLLAGRYAPPRRRPAPATPRPVVGGPCWAPFGPRPRRCTYAPRPPAPLHAPLRWHVLEALTGAAAMPFRPALYGAAVRLASPRPPAARRPRRPKRGPLVPSTPPRPRPDPPFRFLLQDL